MKYGPNTSFVEELLALYQSLTLRFDGDELRRLGFEVITDVNQARKCMVENLDATEHSYGDLKQNQAGKIHEANWSHPELAVAFKNAESDFGACEASRWEIDQKNYGWWDEVVTADFYYCVLGRVVFGEGSSFYELLMTAYKAEQSPVVGVGLIPKVTFRFTSLIMMTRPPSSSLRSAREHPQAASQGGALSVKVHNPMRNAAKTILPCAVMILTVACKPRRADVQGYDASEPVMAKAYADARGSVETFINALRAPKPGWRYLAKVRVEADGEVEHMWMEPVHYDGGFFTGPLANTPLKITSMTLGSKLQSGPDKISDWVILDASGDISEGGFTRKVMEVHKGKSPD